MALPPTAGSPSPHLVVPSPDGDVRTVIIPPGAPTGRLDRLLADALDVPRNQVQQWIRDGHVRIGEVVISRPATSLAGPATLVVTLPLLDHAAALVPEAGELPLLHVDDDLVVLDKPAGLVIHPGAGRREGTLVHRLIARFPELASVGGPGRPGIVHRLDRDTTGVLVVARTARAYQALSRAFAERRVDKTYLAIVWGVPRAANGTIDLAIGRHPTRRKEMTVRADGRPARTTWRTLARTEVATLLALGLETGRTHQIRVHLKAMGHPLLGDPVYGAARWKAVARSRQAALRDFPRPALHAWRLCVPHPADGRPASFASPPPADLRALWLAAGGREWPLAASGNPGPGEQGDER